MSTLWTRQDSNTERHDLQRSLLATSKWLSFIVSPDHLNAVKDTHNIVGCRQVENLQDYTVQNSKNVYIYFEKCSSFSSLISKKSV